MENHLEELYQDIILQHSKRPRNERELDPCTAKAEGYNPLCGDQITVYVNQEDGTIADCSFQAEGCAISRASASMMTEILRGLTSQEAKGKAEEIYHLLTGAEEPEADIVTMGDLAALVGVRKFPARIKCATLAWHALEDALAERDS